MFKDLALLSQVKRWLLSREKGLVMVVLVVVMVVIADVLVLVAVVSRSSGRIFRRSKSSSRQGW